MKILLQINKSGATVLMATHNYNIIHKFPGKVIMCQGGKLVTSTDKLD
jgi:cell division transport system ATP-binding protein